MSSIPSQAEHGSARRLLEQVTGRMRFKHYGIRTGHAYLDWIKQFIRYFDKRHPEGISARESQESLARRGGVQRGGAAPLNLVVQT